MPESGSVETFDPLERTEPHLLEPYLKNALAVYAQFITFSAEVSTARAGDVVYRETYKGKELAITVIHPKSEPKPGLKNFRPGDDPLGSRSLVLKVTYGEFSMLLPTQASLKTIETLAKKDSAEIRADVLLLPKHGHPFWLPDDFLKAVQPLPRSFSTDICPARKALLPPSA